MERAEFDPRLAQNPLTDHHQILHRRLRSGYLPTSKILSRSDTGFHFCTCTGMFTRLFLEFLRSPNVKTPTRILTEYTSIHAAPCKDVFFGVAKPKFKLYTPFTPKTAILGAFSMGLRNFCQKNGFDIRHAHL